MDVRDIASLAVALPQHLVRPRNWCAGWTLLLSAFIVGTIIGLFIHREEFWGGYASYRRRMVRLGHVALAALGMLNILYALSPWPPMANSAARWAGLCLIGGGIAMPLVCFLSGWKQFLRNLFFIPVSLLLLAVILILWQGGGP